MANSALRRSLSSSPGRRFALLLPMVIVTDLLVVVALGLLPLDSIGGLRCDSVLEGGDPKPNRVLAAPIATIKDQLCTDASNGRRGVMIGVGLLLLILGVGAVLAPADRLERFLSGGEDDDEMGGSWDGAPRAADTRQAQIREERALADARRTASAGTDVERQPAGDDRAARVARARAARLRARSEAEAKPVSGTRKKAAGAKAPARVGAGKGMAKKAATKKAATKKVATKKVATKKVATKKAATSKSLSTTAVTPHPTARAGARVGTTRGAARRVVAAGAGTTGASVGATAPDIVVTGPETAVVDPVVVDPVVAEASVTEVAVTEPVQLEGLATEADGTGSGTTDGVVTDGPVAEEVVGGGARPAEESDEPASGDGDGGDAVAAGGRTSRARKVVSTRTRRRDRPLPVDEEPQAP